MKVKSEKCNIGLDGNRYVKGEVFEVDEPTGKRLLAQRTVIRVDVPESIEQKPIVEVKVTEIKPEKPAEEEFKKVGGRWRKTKTKEPLL